MPNNAGRRGVAFWDYATILRESGEGGSEGGKREGRGHCGLTLLSTMYQLSSGKSALAPPAGLCRQTVCLAVLVVVKQRGGWEGSGLFSCNGSLLFPSLRCNEWQATSNS